MLLDSFVSASESKLLGEAFPFYVGVCLVGFLVNLPSEVSFSFEEDHSGILAYLLVELGCLVAKEGKIFRISPGFSGGHAAFMEVHGGPWRSMEVHGGNLR